MAFNFSPTEFVPDDSTSPLPLGNYWVEIETISFKTPKSGGNNRYVAARLAVLAPEEYKGRIVFVNLNVINNNADTQKWALNDFGALCNALEHEREFLEPTDEETEEHLQELRLIGFMVKLGVDKKDATNQRVLKYYNPKKDDMPEPGILANPANDNRPAPRAATPAARPAVATPAKTANPWSKK